MMSGSNPSAAQPQGQISFGGVSGIGMGQGLANNAMHPMMQGYNNALQMLQQSLSASNNTTQGGMMQLGQQLQNNTGAINQGLINKGLGNTTIAATAPQAAQQTYNQGVANLQDQSALRQMGAYSNLAQMAAQGGSQMSQFASPYAQTQYSQNIAQSMQPPQQTPGVTHQLYGGGGVRAF